jgi:tetratricopeptide (TPR) repeat protein
MSLPLSQLQQLMGDLSSSQSQESDLLLMQLDSEDAHRLRLCAIPHTFDRDVLRALDPGLSAQKADQTLEEFQTLPAVTPLGECLILHDVTRQQLFAQWLMPERREEFRAASARLVELYRERVDDTAVEAAAKQTSRLFHLMGADPEEGFRQFQSAYLERRDRARFSDCEALVRLLHEYEPGLDSYKRGWLAYYQAEIADDNRNLTGAIESLDGLRAWALTGRLRSLVLLRSGSVLRQLGRLDAARARCVEALQSVDGFEPGGVRHLIHHELGLIARDSGDFEGARAELERAIELAKAIASRRDVVIAYNSLGTLLLKPAPRDALKLFRECLLLLDPEQDKLRIAQVLNNMGMASADIQEWQASEEYFGRSLQIKRESHDLYGEASTLLNVSRVYRAEQKWVEARGALMTSAKLFEDIHDAVRAAQVSRELARLTKSLGADSATRHYASKASEWLRRVGREAEAKDLEREFGLGAAPKSRWRWLLWTAVALAGILAISVLIKLISDA